MTLLELADDDIAVMLSGAAAVRPGLTQPPGGVDEPDVLRHVREIARQLRGNGYAGGHWMMVSDGEVVGLCGFKAPPSDGEVEIGYGVAASRRRRGHATAAIRAIIERAQLDADVRSIVALTLVDNVGSQRALENNGFERAGTQTEPGGGDLILWRRRIGNRG